jgi:hypothetical protein
MAGRLAIVPPAPALISALAQRLPPQLDDVLAACDRAVGETVAREPEVTVVAVPQRTRDLSWRPAAKPPSQTVPARDLFSGQAGHHWPSGWAVADHLLDRVGFRGVRLRRLLTDDQTLPDGNLLVLADGSAARGDRSPRVGAPGAQFDDTLAEAVRTTDAEMLAAIDDTAAARVGCGTAAAWRALARVAAAAECQWVEVSHPLGVTYVIAVWRLDRDSPRLRRVPVPAES